LIESLAAMTKNEKQWAFVGWTLWLLAGVVISVVVGVNPQHRTVTPIYHDAVGNWWAHRDLYTDPSGFNYLPSFVPFFAVFSWLPFLAADLLWRWSALLGLAVGLWLCCGSMASASRGWGFALATIVALPMSLASLRNGQSSAQLGASLVLAAWCLQTERWNWAAVWLSLSLVCKPLGIPAIGLALVAFPQVWWRLAMGVSIVTGLPYFFGTPAYVTEQYTGFVRNIFQCFDPGPTPFADLNGILAPFNLKLTGIPSLVVRVLAGGVMAVACLTMRWPGTDVRRTLFWLGFTGSYIMLFTPMNEVNSFVMLAPGLALWAWWYLEHGFTRTAQAIVLMSLTMVLLPNLVRPLFGHLAGNQFGMFWSPLMTVGFLGLLAQRMKSTPPEPRHKPAILEYEAAPQ
jgi:hypothetical protein